MINATYGGQTYNDVDTLTATDGTHTAEVTLAESFDVADEGKVVSSGSLVSQTSETYTINDTYDTTLINSVTVNVSGGGSGYSDVDVATANFSANITIPDSVDIRPYAFSESPTIESVFFEGTNKLFGGNAFKNCTALETFVAPYISSISGDSSVPGSSPADMFNGCTALTAFDTSAASGLGTRFFNGCSSLVTLVLRSTTVLSLTSFTNAFTGTPFDNGGTGGTIYIPQSLYEHLGDGTTSDYKSATNWSTLDGYNTITWAKIEGSQYATKYVDGTPISS